jgi:hypothetical protein
MNIFFRIKGFTATEKEEKRRRIEGDVTILKPFFFFVIDASNNKLERLSLKLFLP